MTVPPRGPVRLRLIATADLHAHVLAHDYLADAPLADGGLDRLAPLIERARAEVEGAVLLDDGDFLHGTPVADWAAAERARGRDGPDPVIAAMNRLRYDAAALGNHEFDEPLDGLLRALAQARFPVLCANAASSGPGVRWPVPPWTILRRALPGPDGRRHAVRVGVLGLLPPQTALWARARIGGALAMRPIPEAAAEAVPALRAAGAEVVVALCHSGFGAGEADGAALPLSAVGGIDAMVCGHTHRLFPDPGSAPRPGIDPEGGRVGGVPAVMPGWGGSHLGVVDLDLAPRGGGGWRVAGARSGLRAAGELPQQAGLGRVPAVAKAHAAARRALARPVGRSTIRLGSAFAPVGVAGALDLVAAAKREAARRLLAGGPHAALPLLATAASARGHRATDIPPGPLLARHLLDLHAHADTLVVLRVSGAMLRDWLERAAGRFARVEPGARDAPLLDPAFPSDRFDVIYGLGYAIDLSRPARHDPDGREVAPGAGRVARLEHAGRAVSDDDAFAVATKSHRISGEGLFAPLAAAPRIAGSDVPLRDALAAHVAARSPLGPSAAPDWGFAPLPGASAVFEGPEGGEPPAGVPVERVGPDGPGHLFRLRLDPGARLARGALGD